jgi:hypothetical protein
MFYYSSYYHLICFNYCHCPSEHEEEAGREAPTQNMIVSCHGVAFTRVKDYVKRESPPPPYDPPPPYHAALAMEQSYVCQPVMV